MKVFIEYDLLISNSGNGLTISKHKVTNPPWGYQFSCSNGGHSLKFSSPIQALAMRLVAKVLLPGTGWLDCFQAIDGPSWPLDGSVGEEIAAKGITGFV